jgi:threonylcarbamoyladenosine tRNA methylthiotransferase MtaB
MRFSINTLGCKVNLCESDSISRILLGKGLQQVDYRSGRPHISIINTCTVTAETDRKVRQMIRKIKKANSQAKLVITGCYVTDHADFLKEISADLIIGNEEKKDIPGITDSILDLVKEYRENKERKIIYRGKDDLHSRPIVKIQDGCEQFCAYCIIPRVRGNYYSTPETTILKSIEQLSSEGYGEVVLTGIHIGKYGADREDSKGLPGLLDKIFACTGIDRIRISSIEINEINDELLDVMQKYRERMAPHLHIPLQSGSNKVLKKMERPYSARFFRKVIKKIRSKLPRITLTTDIMVGFPGERAEDLEKTLGLVREIGFSKLHVFKYSPRPGTRAYDFEDRIPSQEKTRRSSILRECGDQMRQQFLDNNTGLILDVAVEKENSGNKIASGTSGNYIRVYFKKRSGRENLKGRIIRVRTEKKYLQGLLGKEAG